MEFRDTRNCIQGQTGQPYMTLFTMDPATGYLTYQATIKIDDHNATMVRRSPGANGPLVPPTAFPGQDDDFGVAQCASNDRGKRFPGLRQQRQARARTRPSRLESASRGGWGVYGGHSERAQQSPDLLHRKSEQSVRAAHYHWRLNHHYCCKCFSCGYSAARPRRLFTELHGPVLHTGALARLDGGPLAGWRSGGWVHLSSHRPRRRTIWSGSVNNQANGGFEWDCDGALAMIDPVYVDKGPKQPNILQLIPRYPICPSAIPVAVGQPYDGIANSEQHVPRGSGRLREHVFSEPGQLQ